MYRIMLADDEGLELNSLKFIVEKGFGDECVVETAKTGRGAIELAERFRPDIAVMDIQMPGINGIDAMREIRRTNTAVKFLILTAYDNFDYAQEAITLGVSSYLTKPIRREVMLEELRKVMAEIDLERTRRRSNLLLREKLENAIPMLEAGIIYAILLRQDCTSVVRAYTEVLDIQQEGGYFLLIDFQEGGEPEERLDLMKEDEKIRQLLKELFRSAVSQLMGMRSLTLVFCSLPEDEYERRLQIMDRVEELRRRLQKLTPIPFSISIGTIQPLETLADSYDQAVAAMEQKSGPIAHYNDLPLSKQWEEGYPQETEYEIYQEAEQGRAQSCCEKARTFFDWMVARHGEEPMDIRLKALELVMRVEYIAFHTGGRTYHFMERHGYLETILALNQYDELKQWYLDKIHHAVSSVVALKDEKNLSTVEQAVQYIDQNYQQDLSLNGISKEVHLSPYYFSKVFKEETGQNFIEYLTQTRMEHAKKLLSATGQSVKEVCSSVGYSDPNYFSRSFKKYTGMTPREYREANAE